MGQGMADITEQHAPEELYTGRATLQTPTGLTLTFEIASCDRSQEVLFVIEVLVGGIVGDARSATHLSERYGRHTALIEQIGRGLEQRFSCGGHGIDSYRG